MSATSLTLMFAVWLMFGILGKPIQKEFDLDAVQLSWISAVVALNRPMWRLPSGIPADCFGGKIVMTVTVILGAITSIGVSLVPTGNYAMLLVLASCVDIVGNLFSSGVTWNSAWLSDRRKGLALGVSGAGNVGAPVTKLIGPGVTVAAAGSTYILGIQGDWHLIPAVYATPLIIFAILLWFITPAQNHKSAASVELPTMFGPLKDVRVWRLSLYYIIVFGAYVAFSATLPTFYVDNFGVSLASAGLLTATFIFPASLLRLFGGRVFDKWGARVAIYITFVTVGAFFTILMLPSGANAEAGQTFGLSLWLVVFIIFLIGCSMGIGKAAAYKHTPTYFPNHMGPVDGFVGVLGGLGGFFLPPLFAYVQRWTGLISMLFILMAIITGATLIWTYLAIQKTKRTASEVDRTEVPHDAR